MVETAKRTIRVVTLTACLLVLPVSWSSGGIGTRSACGAAAGEGNCEQQPRSLCLINGEIISNYRSI